MNRRVFSAIHLRGIFVCVLLALCLGASALSQQPKPKRKAAPGKQAKQQAPAISSDVKSALDHISADSLRGHLSFIASDALEGRNTPSRGLDIAAEYIAAQFRRAGLEPAGDAVTSGERGYFQTAVWNVTARTGSGIELTTADGKQKMRVRENQLPPGSGEPPPPAASVPVGPGQTPPPDTTPRSFTTRNVIGLLRGSDPVLKDTYVVVSAHYDHVGIGGCGGASAADNICNGANDDGSGTVSVVELASALSMLKARPKRSILFITWFGEEKGLQGSRYYGRNPVFPLEKTVAMVNLEQVGRTDSSEGPQLNNATLTGFDFTDMGPIFKAAGEKTGITVYKHEKNSDAFFGRSDNQAMADAGIPAHTLCTAFVYPDYHAAGDHWEKVDYANLAKVNRMVALALLTFADNAAAPKWNEANSKTARYVKAWKTLHGK
ncbi:MAG: M28 family peptidase [Acidobacteriota bacterium]